MLTSMILSIKYLYGLIIIKYIMPNILFIANEIIVI
jgi:hypothetical protein